jgi:hypothetical protein
MERSPALNKVEQNLNLLLGEIVFADDFHHRFDFDLDAAARSLPAPSVIDPYAKREEPQEKGAYDEQLRFAELGKQYSDRFL